MQYHRYLCAAQSISDKNTLVVWVYTISFFDIYVLINVLICYLQEKNWFSEQLIGTSWKTLGPGKEE